VLITLGLYAILYGIIPGLNLEIDLTVVAAFLTLTGYSMNDTVVVFDRVRENMKIHKTLPLGEVINKSINQTMSRTIITGVTTLLTVFVLLIMGGDVLRAFAFTIFFGIIIGTYSSIFVASALVFEYAQRSKKKVQFT
jgi:preprotein translocase SecF subunit